MGRGAPVAPAPWLSVTTTEDEFAARYFSGRELWGDDLPQPQIDQWFADEAEGYANLGCEEEGGSYAYDQLNRRHGFRYLPPGKFDSVLGVGSAYGGEFLSISNRIGRLTILEPSRTLRSRHIGPLTPEYVDPTPSGRIPFADSQFDLACCFGVLHHIPNVSTVVAELARVIRPGGWALLREPIVSMGDWRRPRRGLTMRERGIPYPILLEIVTRVGFECVSKKWCAFPTTLRLHQISINLGFNGRAAMLLDDALSRISHFNYRYHAATTLQKLRPTSAFLVLKRPSVR
jgi:SAM-dependent methyltransferase